MSTLSTASVAEEDLNAYDKWPDLRIFAPGSPTPEDPATQLGATMWPNTRYLKAIEDDSDSTAPVCTAWMMM